MSYKLNSNIQIKEWEKTREGFLKIPVVVISEEVLDYPEFGTQEYIGPDIYSPEFLKQIDGLPFVLEHPMEAGQPVDVTSENYKRYIKGALSNPEAQKEKRRVVADLTVYDKDTASAIEAGDIKELSAKYESVDVKENGTFDGKKYNVKQTNMILNHLALTEAGRAGDKVKVLISKQNSQRRNTMEEMEDDEKKVEKTNEDMELGGEEGGLEKHEEREELTLSGLKEQMDQMMEILTAVVDKIGGTKENADTSGGTMDDDEMRKQPPAEKQNSLSPGQVEAIISERSQAIESARSVLGADAALYSAKMNSTADFMRFVLVKSGEYDANSVKKLNSLQLKAEFNSVAKYASKLNSMQTSQESYTEESGADFFNDSKFLTR